MCRDYLREEAYLFKLDYFDILWGWPLSGKALQSYLIFSSWIYTH